MITRKQLIDAASAIVALAGDYKGAPHREMRLDGLVYGILSERFGATRQHKIHSRNKNSKRSQRIDFRQPGANPVVIELATRTRGRNEIYGSQNRDELRKLARQGNAAMRYLLLLDVARRDALGKPELTDTFDKVLKQRGPGTRKSVRVVYVHPDLAYDFLWPPWHKR
jgi:hypothetical protein